MRKKIGILLVNDDVGVAYYLLSIVKGLGFLDDNEKPEIVLLYSPNCKKYVELYHYQYLTTVEIDYNRNKKLKFLLSVILGRNLFTEKLIRKYKLDGLFPAMDTPVRNSIPSVTIASWIPDFQHKFYPEFFTKENLLLREVRFKKIIGKSDALVLSSNDAYSHLKKFYTIDEKKIGTHVMPFVSMIYDFPLTDYSELVEKYNITTPYFLVSNQFFAHKNHMVVLNAIKALKNSEFNFTVYMTGKTEDHRNPQFFSTLTCFIEDNDLGDIAKILGLIPREDQLGLLKKAMAIIQPSKFEGWSTIIEDAKTFQVQVICSNIDVHVEQMGDRAFYFEPDSVTELADHMRSFLSGAYTLKPVFDNYRQRIQHFASTFLGVFNKSAREGQESHP
jgi:glycosyltransferase involved in cell wall biosynthesis